MSSNITGEHHNAVMDNRLKDAFFVTPCIKLAKRLLGKILVRICSDHTLLKGRIVETECYLGGDDKASFSYNGKVTERNKPMYMKPGTTFVYMTYGMYYCFNISSEGDGAVVLIRAVEPLEGIDTIIKHRQQFANRKNSNKRRKYKINELCNGPSKFCIGFNIDKNSVNQQDLSSWSEMWIENDCYNANDISEDNIVISKRIGIESYGEPWASKPLRFYLYENPFVSKRDKTCEEIIKRRKMA